MGTRDAKAASQPLLIIFGGLSGTGKTSLVKELARQVGAVHLHIDSIEQAMREHGAAEAVRNGAGYSVAYALAADNLRLGRPVIADSVNPLQITRDAWVKVANSAQVRFLEIEVKCSDAGEHRRRVETRVLDVRGSRLPTWKDVVSRGYDAWDREHLVIDTARQTVARSVRQIMRELSED